MSANQSLSDLSTGRVNQKWRTRTALVRAAADLMAEGKEPTIAEAADAARVSRATAYRYFANQETLLFEATNEGSIVPALEAIAQKIPESPDTAMRLDELVKAFQGVVSEHEPALRTLLRLTLEGDPTRSDAVRTRGSYRAYWLDRVLAPLEDQLDEESHKRLVAALSLCMGTEAQLVLCDMHHLTPEEAEEVCRWSASAVLEAGLREAGIEAEPSEA